MSLRLGVMGGMFDPVHHGHLQAARAAADALALDRVYLVPCAVPSHRNPASASAQQRLAMLELALADAGDRRLQVDDREYHRPGISYMVDTLASFADDFPEAARVYVMGWDSLNTLPTWDRWQHLLDYSHICAVSRPGAGRLTDAMDSRNADWLMARRVTSAQALFSSQQGKLYILEGVAEPAASSDVRQALIAGDRDNADLPASVMAYINQHQLYRSTR